MAVVLAVAPWRLAAFPPPAAAQVPAGEAPRLRLSRGGGSFVVFGGQLRERVEGWRGFEFGYPDTVQPNDVFALTRVRLSTDVHLGEQVRVFAEAKSAFATNRRLAGGKRTSDIDELDLQQGYVELRRAAGRRGGNTSARIGRQELAFGRERLVSPSEWSNVRRAFDGIAVTRTRRSLTVTTFLTRPVRQEKYRLNPPDPHRAFYGVYATGATPSGERRADLYWLGFTQDAASVNGTVGPERRHTVGLRLWGGAPLRPGDFDIEAAYQFGSLGGGTISAWMASATVGRRFGVARDAPRLYAAFDYGSGDRTPGGRVGTFNQLFSRGHAHLGYADLVGRQNVVDANGGLQWTVRAPLAVGIEGHRFWRASGQDQLYRANGTAVARPGTSVSKDVGYELDVTVRYPVNPHLLLSGGYSRFLPGRWVRDTGPAQQVEFAYLALQYTL